jgi:hypothetical protein
MSRPLDLTDVEVRLYNDQGYLYLPGLVERDRATGLRQEVLDILAGGGVDRLVNGERSKNVAARFRVGPMEELSPA